MKPWTLAGTTAVLALMAANAALADVTPEDVWQNLQDFYQASGNTVTTGSAARDGDTLVITDLKAVLDENGTTGETVIPEIRLRDMGDGSVEVTLSDEVSFTTSTAAIDDAPALDTTGSMKMPGMTGIVSGTPEAMTYAFTAPSTDIQIAFSEDQKPAGTVGILLSDMTSTYALAGAADAPTLDGSFAAASAALTLAVSGDDGSDVTGVLNAADLSAKMVGNFIGMEQDDLAVALTKGFALDSSFGYGATNYEIDFTDESGPSKLVGGSEGGAFQVAMDAARMLMSGGGKNVAVTITSAQLPFPELKLAYAESGFALTMPLTKGDAPQEFTFLTKLVDLTVSDEVWAMFDPTASLPRDPATVVIDTKGTATLSTDLMADTTDGADPMSQAALNSLDVTELRAKFAGAELTGNGAFTFDNTDLETYDGIPVPTGKLDLALTGGNTLLDKLVAMGLVSDDEAMGARMMMAMFANPGDGEDSLTSVLEFKDKGFFANGQQLQ